MKMIKAAVAGVILVGGIGATAAAKETEQRLPVVQQHVYVDVDDDLTPEQLKEVRITASEAQKLALTAQPGWIKELSLEAEHGTLLYQAEIISNGREIDVYVDALTGEAWREHDPARQQKLVKITEAQARAIALNQVKGTVSKVELDEDDGQYIYEIELRTDKHGEVDIEISATTGAVLDVDWDD